MKGHQPEEAANYIINLEPFDEELERGIRHHCPNCSRLDKERDFRTNPGGLQLDCVRYEQELAAQAPVVEAARRWAAAETSEAYSDALRELRLAVAAGRES